MKKLIALMLAIVMIAAMSSVAFAAEGDAVAAGSVTTVSESTEPVTVDITYTGEDQISSVRLVIDSAIPVTSVSSEYNFVYNPANGKIVIWADKGASFGSSTLCTLTYVISDWYKNGTYPIDIEAIDATAPDSSDVTLACTDGAIEILQQYMLGDLDFNGERTNADLILLARYLVDLEELTPKQLYVSDMNQDGEILNCDLILLARILVDLEDGNEYFIPKLQPAEPAEALA